MGVMSQFSSKAEIHRREVIKRFDDFFLSCFSALETHGDATSQALSVTLIARSPTSAAAQAVLRHGEALALAGCDLRVMFSQVEPAHELEAFIAATSSCNRTNCLGAGVRWAKNPALLDAHEQLVLGAGHCWSGDAMSRSGETRYALDMFETQGGAAIDLARQSFEGLWSLCETIPKSCLQAAPLEGEPVVVSFDGMKDKLLETALTGDLTTRH